MKLDYFKKNHSIALKILLSGIQKQRINHAFLFTGTTYFSKLELSKLYTKILLCKSDEPCEVCEVCRSINENKYFDLHIINEEGSIKTEHINKALTKIKGKSFYEDRRFLIINDAHKMSKAASNRLLIFLENPYDNVIIILISDNLYSLNKTIISRCQSLSFAELNEKKDVSEEVSFFVKCTLEEGLLYLNDNKNTFLKEKNNLLKFLDELVEGLEIEIKNKVSNDQKVFNDINYLHEIKIAKSKLLSNTTTYGTIETLLIKSKGGKYGINRS